MPAEADHIFEFESFRVDTLERVLFRNGEFLPLAPKVIDTLIVLVERAGHIAEKDELMKRVWPDVFVEENNLNKTVSALRKALGGETETSSIIETIPRRGYRFGSPIHVIRDEIEFIVRRSRR